MTGDDWGDIFADVIGGKHLASPVGIDYEWIENKRGNLEGMNIHTGVKRFTWQPHGSQFTIHTPVPEDAVKFTVKRPSVVPLEETLKALNFDETWVNIL